MCIASALPAGHRSCHPLCVLCNVEPVGARRSVCRCPDVVVIPYEFPAYHAVSESVYSILMQHTALVQPLSCDEAYLDVTDCGDPEAIGAAIRAEIQTETGCCASVGIGPSLLIARIATKKAKPDGLFRIEAAVCLPPSLPVFCRSRCPVWNIHVSVRSTEDVA